MALSDESLLELERVLSVPLDLLQEIASNEELRPVLEGTLGFVSSKQAEAEEYETVMAQLSVALEDRDKQLGEQWVATFQFSSFVFLFSLLVVFS